MSWKLDDTMVKPSEFTLELRDKDDAAVETSSINCSLLGNDEPCYGYYFNVDPEKAPFSSVLSSENSKPETSTQVLAPCSSGK